MKTLITTDNGVAIVVDKKEARVSHFDLSAIMAVLPESTMKLILRYEDTLKEHGVVGFKIRKPIKGTGGGRPEQVAWLNENQCFFILALSRNSDQVVRAKSNMIKAFKAARDALAQHETQYLPMFHTAHDSIQSLVTMAHTNGSTTPEHIFHMSYEKLINKVIGIDAGQRECLNLAQQCAFTAAYATIYNIAQRGLDHKQTYQMVKNSLPKVIALLGISPRLAA